MRFFGGKKMDESKSELPQQTVGSQEKMVVREVEVNLSLLNDKLNYIISLLDQGVK